MSFLAAGAVGRRRSATSSASSTRRTTAACSGCSGTRRCRSGWSRSSSIGLIVVYHGRAGSSRYLSITLGLLLGGALGNLIDRLRLGYVVDFVDAGIGDLRWYTFNVADAGISFALLLLLAASIWPAIARRVAVDA